MGMVGLDTHQLFKKNTQNFIKRRMKPLSLTYDSGRFDLPLISGIKKD
jgi:hypothetical protein